jgi:hypothetical protein
MNEAVRNIAEDASGQRAWHRSHKGGTVDKEYWATFSIYDYQTPRYRRSLVLFDKVVIPIPTAPIGSVTEKELERLSVEVAYLEKEGVAVGLEWSRDQFNSWREARAGEAIAALIDKDRQLATRLQVQEAVEKGEQGKLSAPRGPVRAIPVYADWQEFDTLWTGCGQMRVFDIVAQQLALPSDDASLEDIVRLRAEKSFRESMRALRSWQDEVFLDLLKAQSNNAVRQATLQKAVNDLEKWMKQYREALDDAKFKKVKTAVVSVLGVAAALLAGAGPLIVTLAALAPPLFDFRDVVRPTWQSTTNLECAPVGVVYESSGALEGT